jgi:eukaryotic-like serine/threonine-protein kinase
MAPVDPFGLTGSTIDGKYRVDGVVEEGGFGVVYRGQHLSFDQAIAIKCLKVPPHFTGEAQELFLSKFREEGKHLAKLSEHRSVVRVYDYGTTQSAGRVEVPFLIMEWLEGETLEAHLEGRQRAGQAPLAEAEALALLRPAIEAVAFAHRSNIAHRDLKPANLFLARTGLGDVVKVFDFGIAKAMQEGDSATRLAVKTTSGFGAFTPRYGAPEQFHSTRFGGTGPWTDVHAFGLILVECVAGRPALAGEEDGDYFVASTGAERPTPRRCGASVTDGFEQLCAKALALVPTSRYRHADELLEALDELAGAAGRPRAAPRAPAVPRAAADPNAIAAPNAAAAPTAVDAPARAASPERTVPAIPARGAADATPVTRSPGRVRLVLAGGAAVVAVVVGVAVQRLRSPTGQGEPSSTASPSAGPLPAPSSIPSSEPSVSVASPSATSAAVELPGMARLAAGRFTMGASDGDDDERPMHDVEVQSFALDLTEVTLADYRSCVSLGSCTEPNTGGACVWGKPDRDSYPVNCVVLAQAKSYCAFAGKRLPSEKEWEYAARGTENRRFPWGNSVPGAQLCWSGQERRANPCPVGSYPAGPQGFRDLAGNVWEWTSSFHCGSYADACQSGKRVLRGGGYIDDKPAMVRASNRQAYFADKTYSDVGFRCAKD